MLRSATFTLGLLLAGLAFGGFLMLGGMMAPPPYSIVVAVQDIPAYSVLDPNALGVDSQRINGQVAQTLVQREEIDQYAGGFVVENIHAGEPLRKGAVVAAGNPQAATRLALAMTDPDKVAMVIPVDPKTSPAQIAPGDWLDLVVGLAPGNISASNASTFSALLSPTPAAFSLSALGPSAPSTGPTTASAVRPTPTPALIASSAITSSTTGNVSAGDMNLPADKVVIQAVPVLAVRYQQMPNPAFTGSGASFGQSGSSQASTQPAYIQGDIQTVTVLVPRASIELLTFGLDNGRVHVALLPAKTGEASDGAQPPTLGFTFNDVLAWMMHERALAASGQPPSPTPIASLTPGAIATVAPTPVGSGTRQPTLAASVAQPAPQVASAQGQPTAQARPSTVPSSIPTGFDLTALLIPLSCGVVLLILFVVAVRFIRQRRRDNELV